MANKETSPIEPTAEKQARKFGRMVGGMLPKGWGYVMLMFKFGPKNSMPAMPDVTYLSNGDRRDMINTMRAFASVLEAGLKKEQAEEEGEEEVEQDTATGAPPAPQNPPTPPVTP